MGLLVLLSYPIKNYVSANTQTIFSHDVLHVLCVPLGCSLRYLCFVYSLCAVLLCVFVSHDVLHALCVPLGCSLRSLCFVYSLCAVLLCVFVSHDVLHALCVPLGCGPCVLFILCVL